MRVRPASARLGFAAMLGAVPAVAACGETGASAPPPGHHDAGSSGASTSSGGSSGAGGASGAGAISGSGGTTTPTGGAGIGATGGSPGGGTGAMASGAGGMNGGTPSVAGTGGTAGDPPMGGASAGGMSAPGGSGGARALSFRTDIYPVFDVIRDPPFVYPGGSAYESCTTSGVCHGGERPGAGLRMSNADEAYSQLLNAASESELCAGATRVVPGNPAQSCLILFYEGRLRDELDWVDTAEIDLVGQWIADGALP